MKISRRQLQKIILEEQKKLAEKRRVDLITQKTMKTLKEQALSRLGRGSSFVGSRGRQQATQIISQASPDAMAIYKALKGLGTDEDTVYAVLNRRATSIPQLYEEYSALLMTLKQESSGFMGKVKKYGLPFLTGSGLVALATFLDPER